MQVRLLLGSVGGGDLCGSVRILLREALDAACRIDQLLLAGEERVAVRADFDAQHVAFDGRARRKSVAAGAVHGYFVIVGMNTGFHGAPVCRVRSARLPGWGTTAASLGRETIVHYTRSGESFKTGIPECDGCSKPAILSLRLRSYNHPRRSAPGGITMSTNTTAHVAEISVLIVGAGPTGLTLACELARRGVDFRIVDKAPAYFAGSRGKGLQPRSLEVLNDLGVVEKILANGRFHLPFRAYDGTTVIGDRDAHEGRHPTPDIPYASVLIIPQWRVEEILRGLLAELGGKVELATELVELEQDAEIVTATLQSADKRHQVRARYVVAADGGRSFVRKHLNVGFEGETWKDERMLVGDVHVDRL